MSTNQERYDAIAQNYQSALNNEIIDKANAKTAADIAAITANVASAAVAFYSATVEQLSATRAPIESDYNSAVAANKAVTEARSEAAELPTLLGKLTSATSAATKLAASAKGI